MCHSYVTKYVIQFFHHVHVNLTLNLTIIYHKFYRIMQGEAHTDLTKIRRKERIEQAKKNLGKSWTPSSRSKLPSGQGSTFGCFQTHHDSFAATTKPKDKYKAPGHNLYTSPGKHGTGYGYLNITIGNYHKHSSDPYDRASETYKKSSSDEIKKRKGGPFKLSATGKEYFDDNPYIAKKSLPPAKDSYVSSKDKFKPFKQSSPAKLIGGCKAGTFTSYPEHSKEPYPPKISKRPSKAFIGGIFRPSPIPKSTPCHSIMTHNIDRVMNSSNFLTVKV